MVESTLKNGVYVLSEDVTNPTPDRRTKFKLPSVLVWKKGTRFYFYEGNDHRAPSLNSADLRGEICDLDRDAAAWKAVTEKLVPAPPSLEPTLLYLQEFRHCDARDVLGVLLDSGKITIEDIRSAGLAYDVMIQNEGVEHTDPAKQFNLRHEFYGPTYP